MQVFVSIQSLILVPDPFFNEPGYEQMRFVLNENSGTEEIWKYGLILC
jgi:hypothetical protein